MVRRSTQNVESPGNDSFLDVITNVVGILIILVMVVAEHAKTATVELPPDEPAAELVEAQAQVAALEGDVRRITGQMATVQSTLAGRSAERGNVSTMVTAVEQEVEKRRGALDAETKRRFDLERDLALARAALARFSSERIEAEKYAEPETIKIESYPTPIGKTVDNKEVHFQLLNGRLTFVPFEAMVGQLKGAMRDLAARFEEEDEISDSLGPVGGFRMNYNIVRQDTPRGSFLQVTRVEMIPTSDLLGEPLDTALAPKSAFRGKLEMLSPHQYTVTVWTYPDSFAEFRKLKKELYTLGYAVAARPLPAGMPIGASPNGSKSSAE